MNGTKEAPAALGGVGASRALRALRRGKWHNRAGRFKSRLKIVFHYLEAVSRTLVKIRDAGLWRGQSLLADAAIAPHQRAYGKECEGTAAALHFGFD
jgi:hypothetical protein